MLAKEIYGRDTKRKSTSPKCRALGFRRSLIGALCPPSIPRSTFFYLVLLLPTDESLFVSSK